ncbi:uncharacterized protein LOC126354571 [Schistocerca gregaria]|uniref:uncharacterized protein LOC126354571 n=1 Tax=Schistocerca gregaria TaxID=7010 RepID=UPI00211E5FFE|nr:uncharacterized protein LOC126354571 [Schistocerca gregaria]
MIKQPVIVDVGTTKHESGRKKTAVGARPRSRSVGKTKLESKSVKQPFKPYITVDDETLDGDSLSRKHSATNSQVKKFISLPSSTVMDDASGLAPTMENSIYDSKYRRLRTTSFNAYKSNTILHKTTSSRLSTAVDAGVNRHFEPKVSQYKIGDIQSYKLLDDLDITDEEAMDTEDSEATDDPDENDDAAEAPSSTGDAEGEATGNTEGEATGNPEDVTDEQNENEDGQPGPPSGYKSGSSDSVEDGETAGHIVLVQFLLLAFVCKAVSLFFQQHKCTC